MFTFFVNYILGSVPTWMWPAIAFIGVIVYLSAGVLSALPEIKPYAAFLRPITFLVFCYSIFMWGGSGVASVYQAAINEAKEQVKIAQQESADATKALAEALASQNNATNAHNKAISKDIEANKTHLDKECNKFDDSAWGFYNRAVTNDRTKK